ncbi:MAG TPA: IPT/TIG domain-containing protein [Acidimicrobiales bacterium]|nr:IPT/TIG domain-containing protein [Acidimicrobiales bacterium]
MITAVSSGPSGPRWRRVALAVGLVALAGLGTGAVVSGAGAASNRPVVDSVSPDFGIAGDIVTITGTNFTGVTGVDFGLTTATFTFESNTTISATVPSGVGVVNVSVTTGGGTSAANANDKFNYGPSVTSLTPAYGSASTSVTITGTNFIGVTAVDFGLVALSATNYTVNGPTSITATPPGGTNTVDVTVTTAGGQSAVNAGDRFDYGPTVTGLTAAYGSPLGGTVVTISGTNFTGATAVNFGLAALAPITGFTVNSSTSITATSPSGTGVVDVVVTTPGGQSVPNSNSHFSYAPAVTGLSPDSGPALGGTLVTITGTNFTGATSVEFGTTVVISPNFTVLGDTTIDVTSPSSKVSSAVVRVTTPGGESPVVPADTFGYGPELTLVKPNFGVGTGGTQVTIVGANLKSTTAVDFGNAKALAFTIKSAKKIVAIAPVGSGIVDVTLVGPGGTSPIIPSDQFDYASKITNISPAFGKPAGGTKVTITGTNFTGASTVDFGLTPAPSFTVINADKIEATSPAGAGTVYVTVVTPGGTSPAQYEFTY